MVDHNTYEVFKKCADNTTVSIEAVKGLEVAKTVLASLRAGTNDEYYLFDPSTGNVIDPEHPWAPVDPLAS